MKTEKNSDWKDGIVGSVERYVQMCVWVMLRVLAFALAIPPAHGQALPRTVFSGIGVTNVGGSNVSWVVVPATGDGSPVVSYVNVRGDNATSLLRFYNVQYTTNKAQVSDTGTQSTNTPFTSPLGNTFAANDVVVLQHAATDTYERRSVSAVAGTNVAVNTAWSVTPVAGDILWKMSTNGYVVVGDAAVQIIGTTGGIYSGPQGVPILAEAVGIGTNTVSVNLLNAYFLKR